MSLFTVDLFNVSFGEQDVLAGKKNHSIKMVSLFKSHHGRWKVIDWTLITGANLNRVINVK